MIVLAAAAGLVAGVAVSRVLRRLGWSGGVLVVQCREDQEASAPPAHLDNSTACFLAGGRLPYVADQVAGEPGHPPAGADEYPAEAFE